MKHKLIYIADDHEIVTQGISEFLSKEFHRIKSFSNGTALLSSIKECSPDILILDLNLPGKNGLEILKIISDNYFSIKVIVLTMYNETSLIDKCKKNGSSRLFIKNFIK